MVKSEVDPKILSDIIKPACDKFTKQYKSTFKKEFEPGKKDQNEK